MYNNHRIDPKLPEINPLTCPQWATDRVDPSMILQNHHLLQVPPLPLPDYAQDNKEREAKRIAKTYQDHQLENYRKFSKILGDLGYGVVISEITPVKIVPSSMMVERKPDEFDRRDSSFNGNKRGRFDNGGGWSGRGQGRGRRGRGDFKKNSFRSGDNNNNSSSFGECNEKSGWSDNEDDKDNKKSPTGGDTNNTSSGASFNESKIVAPSDDWDEITDSTSTAASKSNTTDIQIEQTSSSSVAPSAPIPPHPIASADEDWD